MSTDIPGAGNTNGNGDSDPLPGGDSKPTPSPKADASASSPSSEMDPSKSYNIDGHTDNGKSDESGDDTTPAGPGGSGGVERYAKSGVEDEAAIIEAPSKHALGPPDVSFTVDSLGRQYKTDLLTGKRVGNFGRNAKSGLASRVPKPLMMDDWTWRKAKAQWLKNDDAGKKALDEELLALACVEVDLDDDDEAIARHRDNLNARQNFIDDVSKRFNLTVPAGQGSILLIGRVLSLLNMRVTNSIMPLYREILTKCILKLLTRLVVSILVAEISLKNQSWFARPTKKLSILPMALGPIFHELMGS